MNFRLPFLLCMLLAINASAVDSLRVISSRPISASAITTDYLGNIYAILTDNTIVRYNEKGDSTGFYRSALNGDISFIDATNPLKILLYYPSFNKVALLDRQLALKTEVDLRKLNIFVPTAVGIASDGNLWVYDPINAKLLKLDENGVQISEGTDLRQQLSFVPQASSLLERDRRLYLCDTTQGILVFDQFATYITTLPFKGIRAIQAFDQQIVFIKGDTLHSYNMQTFHEKRMQLPQNGERILGVSLAQRVLAVLYGKELMVYSWPDGK